MSDNTPETQTLASAAAFAYARRSMCSDAAPAALAVTGSWHAEQPATASAHAAAKALAEAWAKATALALALAHPTAFPIDSHATCAPAKACTPWQAVLRSAEIRGLTRSRHQRGQPQAGGVGAASDDAQLTGEHGTVFRRVVGSAQPSSPCRASRR
jgi:hypothetical protein